MQEKRKRMIILTVCVMSLMFASILGTYAYFTSNINNDNNLETQINMGTMSLIFDDNDNGINAKLTFGETVTKKFTIQNTGTLNTSLSLEWEDLINTYLNGSLSYRLEYAETEDGEYQTIVDTSNIPVSSVETTQTLASELSVPAGETYYYNLIITLNNLADIDQTSDKDASFTTRFEVNQPIRYRRYKLTVDPNGGVWLEFTSPQEYQLKNGETLGIPDPTRDGYTFTGWSIDGVSSELNGNTFSMGISNSTLTANWTVNKYDVSIDGKVEEVDYNSSIELTIPTKEGYTFTGWNTTGGTLDGNTFTLTEAKDITITSTFVVNNYKYIVYHNQMNTSGNGYTLVSADTDEGEAAFGSIISPNTKVYQGFIAPNKQSLTIRVDNSNPPTLNKVDYNYERNKYNLTIDPNGGTYTGSTSLDLYYGASTNINTPSKVGYNFTNWTNTGSGSINGTTYTMGIGNSTLRANYTPKTYSVTFNANGGVTSTQSKTVTYDSTYGDLPTPTYEGYKFLGWFTSQTGGQEITSNSEVKLSDNQTLFAHWKESSFIYSTVTAILNNQPVEGINEETPNFINVSVGYEGVYAMEDDYGMSYYYRGAAENNYLKFAGFYWRIIRVNGDGSVRIIYDGTKGHANGVNDIDRLAYTGKAFNSKFDDNKYIGWMFGGAQGEASTSKAQAQTNETNSDLKTLVDSWYKTNIVDKNFANKIADKIFCNDRTTPGKSVTNWSSDTGLGYGKNYTAFGASSRVGGSMQYVAIKPNLKCPQKNDAFTVEDTENGNGDLTYPVGLITVDELVIAGSGKFSAVGDSGNYSFKGAWYWSLSPARFNNTDAYMYMEGGDLKTGDVDRAIFAVAPVINLKAEYVITMKGTGTITDPYRDASDTL